MKVCEICGDEICTKDGENVCCECQDHQDFKRKLQLKRVTNNRKAKEEMLRSLGLVKVKGAMGGTYWE